MSQTEFQDAESCLKQADFEFKNRRYQAAASLYAKALEFLRETRAPGHTDITYCMQNLSDAYAINGDYQEAYDTLLQLLEIRKQQPGLNNVDLISTKYKIAKMLEIMDRYAEAVDGYDDAMKTGDQSLYEGHPLRTVIYLAYLEMLQKHGGGNPQLIMNLTNRVERGSADLELGDKLLDGMHLRSFIGLVKIEKKPEPVEVVPEAVESAEVAAPAKSPVKMIAIVAAVVVIAGIAGAAFMMSKHEEKKVAQKAATAWVNKNFEGQIFESPSGQDKLVFLFGGNVDSILDGVKRQLPVTVLPPDADFISNSGNVMHTRFFKRVENGMMADNGRMLYADNAAEEPIVQRVKAVAAAAQKYYEEHKEYPKSSKDLTDIDPKLAENPISKKEEDLVFVEAGKERDFSPDQTPAVADDLEKGLMMSGEPQRAPGTMHCYTFLTGDKYVEGVKCVAFFIRPVGVDGRWLPGNAAGQAYCAVMIAGREPNVAGLFTPKAAGEGDGAVKGIKVIADK